jgi:predicted nucleic acid-binding protein
MPSASIASVRSMVDTNILIYAHDTDQGAKHDRSVDLLSELLAEHRLVLSAQILNEFYAATTRPRGPFRLSHGEAGQVVRELAAMAEVTPMTASTTLRSLDAVPHHGLAFWDALIWAAAMENGVSVIYSEDFQDGRVLEGVRYINPFAVST